MNHFKFSSILFFLFVVSLLLIGVESSSKSLDKIVTNSNDESISEHQSGTLNGQQGTFNWVIRKWLYDTDLENIKLTFKNSMLHCFAEHLYNIAVTKKKVELRDETVYADLMQAVEFLYSWKTICSSPKSVTSIIENNDNKKKNSKPWFSLKYTLTKSAQDNQVNTKTRIEEDKDILMLKYFEAYCLQPDQKCYEIIEVDKWELMKDLK